MDLKSDFHIDSLSVAAELIGPNHDSAAFIFGFMSLLDKLTCGIVVIGIQGVTHIVFRGLGKYQTCPGTKKSSNIIFNHPLQSQVSGASVVEDCEGCLLGHEGCFPFYSKVLFFVCGSAALIGALSMFTLVPFEIGRRSFKKRGLPEHFTGEETKYGAM